MFREGLHIIASIPQVSKRLRTTVLDSSDIFTKVCAATDAQVHLESLWNFGEELYKYSKYDLQTSVYDKSSDYFKRKRKGTAATKLRALNEKWMLNSTPNL